MSDQRKDKQLCAQVRRVLSQYLSFEAPDEVLQNLFVEGVEPAPDATCVSVTLSVPSDLDVEKGDTRPPRQRVLAVWLDLDASALKR